MSKQQPIKPLGTKAYGSIPHLVGSRRGPADKGVNDGQQRICCERPRDRFDTIIVQEKLDGSNVAVANIDGAIVPLNRAGYRAESSTYEQHRLFGAWAYQHQDVFAAILAPGERLCGEWLAQAHGTRYDLGSRSPFVVFDLMRGTVRTPWQRLVDQVEELASFFVAPLPFELPPLVHIGKPIHVDEALSHAGNFGRYGATDPIEGVVYRVERHGKGGTVVDFLAKYVRPLKVDGRYFPENNGGECVWNWRPA